MYILLAVTIINLYTGDMAKPSSAQARHTRKIPIVQTFDNKQDCEETLAWLRRETKTEGQCKRMRQGAIWKE